MDRKRWTGGCLGPFIVSFVNLSGVLSVGFHDGEPEARHQLQLVSETTTVAQCSLMMSISNMCCNTQNYWVYGLCPSFGIGGPSTQTWRF
jgi:hypothetical protein